MKFILGKKLSMTQIWRNDLVVPVTRIQVEPCVITQIKTVATDGYRAVQLATGQLTNPQRMRECKKDVARVKTLIRERELKAAE